MFYYAYEDDGPKGICGQAMSITLPWRNLWITPELIPNSEMNDRLDVIKKGRDNPRIVGIWSDNADEIILSGFDEAIFLEKE